MQNPSAQDVMVTIGEVRETSSTTEVSSFLSSGWVLLTVGAGVDEEGHACMKYCLGKPRE